MAQAGAGSRRVLIGHGLHRDRTLESVLLPHPATGKSAAFLLSPDGGLLELNHMKSEFTSWFVGDSVVEDGGLYAATVFDILFVLLPVLDHHRKKTGTHDGRFCSAEHLLDDPQCPVLARLRSAAEQALPAVCSVQQVGEESFFRLDDARVLAWLSLKVDAVVASLRAGAAAGAAFEALNHEQLTAYAVDLMGEYLAPALLDRLRTHLRCSASAPEGVSMAPLDGHRHSDASFEPDSKRPKAPVLSAAAKNIASRLATAKAKNAKAAEGCVNLASLFGKPKPT